MKRILDAAWVIARRDFVATVWSRSFVLFLLAPIIALSFGGVIGGITGQADVEASRPKIAVVTDPDSAAAIESAHARVAVAVGETRLAELKRIDPAEDVGAQARYLLASSDRDVSAVLGGSLDKPVLYGPTKAVDGVSREVALVVGDARRARTLAGGGLDDGPVKVATVVTGQSAGNLNTVRHILARAGQFLIFFLTLMLATMLLSNLVEEKSNKVIEVLAAAVPLDAVFLGKLIAMLGVSIVGILIWGAMAGAALLLFQNLISTPVMPAVGWPAYCILVIAYFAANYMLLGAVFLGIGGQASNVREVQTLSMPITLAQLMILALASLAVGNDGTIAWVAAIFPLSSPLTMIALAAQSETLWIHPIALVWQMIWIALIIRVSARLFRLTVLKSGTKVPFFDFLSRTKSAASQPAPVVPAEGNGSR